MIALYIIIGLLAVPVCGGLLLAGLMLVVMLSGFLAGLLRHM